MPHDLITDWNIAGAEAIDIALRMSLQVALLVVALSVVDFLVRSRVRATLRCGLWMLAVVKLLLPPGFLLPTGISYWLGPSLAAPVRVATTAAVTSPTLEIGANPETTTIEADDSAPAPRPRPTLAAWLALGWLSGSLTLATLLLLRHRAVRRIVRQAAPAPPSLTALLRDAAHSLGLTRVPALRITPSIGSPAICGLVRPVILVPEVLVGRLDDEAWITVFLHELVHLQRRDLGWNGLQTIVQVLWWWNPCVWLIQRRLHALREAAVDEAVMLASNADNDRYPATLVAVARLCAVHTSPTLGFLGILESGGRLEARIRRLIEQPLPTSARLGWSGWAILLVAALTLLPMGFLRRIEAADNPAQGNARSTNPSVETPPKPTVPPGTPATPGAIPNPNALFTRTFRVDPTTFLRAIADASGRPLDVSTPTNEMQLTIRDFFAALGFRFPSPADATTPSQDQWGLFFNPSSGQLFVRAPAAELDGVERAIHVLGMRPPQITIESQWIAADPAVVASLGIPWNGTTNTTATGSARLTARQTGEILAALKAAPGTDLLSSPRVTTLSARQASIAVGESIHVVTGLTNSPGGSGTVTNRVTVGPTLDLIPLVDALRTNAIHLVAAGQVVEFLGYQPSTVPTPILSTNAARARALLWDGQTLALSLGRITNVIRFADKVPVLGDIPILGRLFRSEGTNSVVKHRLALITPTLIDPAGNRINDPAHLPFPEESLPSE